MLSIMDENYFHHNLLVFDMKKHQWYHYYLLSIQYIFLDKLLFVRLKNEKLIFLILCDNLIINSIRKKSPLKRALGGIHQ